MRRAVDLVVASVGAAVLALPGALIALAVRLTMGNPVLFRQQRSGWHGEEFSIAKFRTMRAERFPGEPDADRLTRLGHLLRSTSLDELPQLLNVLRGEMSLIGPRPTLPEQVAHYSQHQRRRLEVRPGITGYAQVKGRNSITWPERIELDIWYIDHRSLRLDWWILVMTVRNLLRREGITGPGGVNQGFPLPDPEP
ncbi:MAG TPA: sugar transferase [Acidimicrobiales bacterium]|nr:sugar transferase [Acidimicrobiales bacterium]